MNTRQRIAYSAKHIRRMRLFEAQFLRPIYNALQSQIKPVVAHLRLHGAQAAINAVDGVVLNEHIAPVIQDIYKTVGLYFANKTIHDLKQSVKVKAAGYYHGNLEYKAGFGYNDQFIQDILNYFAAYLLDKAVIPITDTTKAQIVAILNQGIAEGWGVDKIAMALESSDLTLWRARMIVRTESNKAMNYGQRLGESKSIWQTTKTWVAANDHRTRHSHRQVDDETVDFNKFFHVPIFDKGVLAGADIMEGPGDIHASAGNVINCRCVLSFASKRDENGRLIRKPLYLQQEAVT
jgi:hypothetical protein